jgi:hypothetical protein
MTMMLYNIVNAVYNNSRANMQCIIEVEVVL